MRDKGSHSAVASGIAQLLTMPDSIILAMVRAG